MKPLYRLLGASISLLAVTYYLYHIRLSHPLLEEPINHEDDQASKAQKSISEPSIGTVVASQTRDNTTWLPSLFPDWHHNIFVADQPDATLSVPQNKGREVMTYLTYIIDNYSSLPDIAIFLHAERYQWHNDDPLYDGARTLSRLQLTYILEQGYVNLRCVWTLGCPHEIHPLDHPADEITSETHADQVYAAAFKELFPDAPIPESIGVSCCAQFAVSKATILQRPREEYERYRRWLLETDLEDGLSGRVLEYSWHSEKVYVTSIEIYTDLNEQSYLAKKLSSVRMQRSATARCLVSATCSARMKVIAENSIHCLRFLLFQKAGLGLDGMAHGRMLPSCDAVAHHCIR